MKKLITTIVSGLILTTSVISTFNSGAVLNASEENINLFECYVDDTEKDTINSQIQSFNDDASGETEMYSIGSSGVDDTSFIIDNYDLDNSYKIYSTDLIDENATDFKSYINSSCEIEVPFINQNGETNVARFQQNDDGIEFIGIKFGENTFPSVSETYDLINTYLPDSSVEEVKFIDLRKYDKMCVYVSSNDSQYIIDLTNDESTNIYTAEDFINQLDLSINDVYRKNLEYFENGEYDKIVYVGRTVSNNEIQINNVNAENNKNISHILIISCSISVIVIVVSIVLLKKNKN